MSDCFDLMYLAHKFYATCFCTQLFSKLKKKNLSAKPGETNCEAYLVLARIVEEYTTETIFLLLVGDIQINKKLDRIRVMMQVINIFKALELFGSNFLQEGGVLTLITSKDLQSPGLSAWHLLSLLLLKRRD